MRMSLIGPATALALALLAAPVSSPSAAPTDQGAAIFEARCKECHDPGDDRAPSRAVLATKTPQDIVAALTTGPMAPIAEGLTLEDKQAIAAYLAAP